MQVSPGGMEWPVFYAGWGIDNQQGYYRSLLQVWSKEHAIALREFRGLSVWHCACSEAAVVMEVRSAWCLASFWAEKESANNCNRGLNQTHKVIYPKSRREHVTKELYLRLLNLRSASQTKGHRSSGNSKIHCSMINMGEVLRVHGTRPPSPACSGDTREKLVWPQVQWSQSEAELDICLICLDVGCTTQGIDPPFSCRTQVGNAALCASQENPNKQCICSPFLSHFPGFIPDWPFYGLAVFEEGHQNRVKNQCLNRKVSRQTILLL